MNKPRQFLPVLKQMLGFYLYGPLPLLIYLAVSAAVLLVSSIFLPIGWMESHAHQSFWREQLFWGCCFWWYLLMLVATPLPFQVLGGTMSLEFLFTRAVDRRLWLRAERVAVIIIGLGPFILNLALSPLGPKLTFEPAGSGSAAAAVQQRYLDIFPGSHLASANSSGQTEQLIIRHGTEMFAAWLVWLGMISVFAVAAYFSLAFASWQRAGWHHSRSSLRPWLGTVMVNGPAFLPIPLLLLFAGLHINILEESFLLFAAHPILMTLALLVLIFVAQRLSERNIRRLEFEFF